MGAVSRTAVKQLYKKRAYGQGNRTPVDERFVLLKPGLTAQPKKLPDQAVTVADGHNQPGEDD